MCCCCWWDTYLLICTFACYWCFLFLQLKSTKANIQIWFFLYVSECSYSPVSIFFWEKKTFFLSFYLLHNQNCQKVDRKFHSFIPIRSKDRFETSQYNWTIWKEKKIFYKILVSIIDGRIVLFLILCFNISKSNLKIISNFVSKLGILKEKIWHFLEIIFYHARG